MGWALGIVGLLVVLALAFPVPRRGLVLGWVAVRRGLPVLGRKLRLVGADCTTARAFRLGFEDLGPAYLKFGQMIASSPTAFSKQVTEEFGKCLDEVRPIPVAQVWRIIEHELGDHPERIFASIDPEPLASASIAQVHAATLQSGAPVVIKVQRPGIRARVESDLGLMAFWARVAEAVSKLMRHANLSGIVADFRKTIRE